MNWLRTVLIAFFSFLCLEASAVSEIAVGLKLDANAFVVGERVRAVVDVANSSPDEICVGGTNSLGKVDYLLVEVRRTSSGEDLEMANSRPFVSPFRLAMNEGQKLETFIADHYGLTDPGSYTARAVLVHARVRYESPWCSFDVVPGVKLTGALQIFTNHSGLQREFDVVKWSRGNQDHVFLKACDVAPKAKRWPTYDLGTYMRLAPPTVSVLTNGEVLVVHRADPNAFLRSVFWSVGNGVYSRGSKVIRDPETAGQDHVKSIFNDGKPVEATDSSWWKFWK